MMGRNQLRLSILVLILMAVGLVYAWLNPSEGPQTLRRAYSPIVLAIAVPILIALAAWMFVFVGRRRRQARAQLSRLRSAYPGAVIFEVAATTPGVLNQVDALRSAAAPPLPPIVRGNRPLIVSVDRAGVTMWWGDDRVLHLDRQLVRATGTTVIELQYTGTAKSPLATVTMDVGAPDGRLVRLALPLVWPADERVSIQPGKLTVLAEQLHAGMQTRLGLPLA